MICKRCGGDFGERYSSVICPESGVCAVCEMRNLLDGLGMPTPPSLLDAHSKYPTLTDEEYLAELNGIVKHYEQCNEKRSHGKGKRTRKPKGKSLPDV